MRPVNGIHRSYRLTVRRCSLLASVLLGRHEQRLVGRLVAADERDHLIAGGAVLVHRPIGHPQIAKALHRAKGVTVLRGGPDQRLLARIQDDPPVHFTIGTIELEALGARDITLTESDLIPCAADRHRPREPVDAVRRPTVLNGYPSRGARTTPKDVILSGAHQRAVEGSQHEASISNLYIKKFTLFHNASDYRKIIHMNQNDTFLEIRLVWYGEVLAP